jgi:hypothetical protein
MVLKGSAINLHGNNNHGEDWDDWPQNDFGMPQRYVDGHDVNTAHSQGALCLLIQVSQAEALSHAETQNFTDFCFLKSDSEEMWKLAEGDGSLKHEMSNIMREGKGLSGGNGEGAWRNSISRGAGR